MRVNFIGGASFSVLCFIFLLVISATGQTGQQLGFQLENKRKKVVIPVEILSNLVVVPVTLNGIIPLKFILDTGVRTTILTKKEYADLLGLTYSRKYTISGLGENKFIDAFITNNVSLSMPGVRGVGHSLLALKEDYLNLRNYLGAEVHGILGYELFSRFVVEIDYGRKTLTLMSLDRFRPKRKSQILPISVQDTKPYLRAPIQSKESDEYVAKLLVDTGASHGLLLRATTNNSIPIPEKNIGTVIGRGLGGLITGRVGRINYLKLGVYKIDNPVVHFPDSNSYMNIFLDERREDRNGTLGGGILSRFVVTFNFPEEKIYFKKGIAYRAKSNYDMSGLTIKADGHKLNEYKIIHIVPHSPGMLAGLQIGDRILAINGKEASDLALDYISGLLSSRENRLILLRIERGDKRLRVSLRLTNFI